MNLDMYDSDAAIDEVNALLGEVVCVPGEVIFGEKDLFDSTELREYFAYNNDSFKRKNMSTICYSHKLNNP